MSIWYGFVGWIEAVILWFFHWSGNAVLTIVVFGLLIRLAVWPLTLRSMRSMRAMHELQPLVDEIQARHGADHRSATRETLELYSKHKAHPVDSLLPMFVQIPFFIGMYDALSNLTRSINGGRPALYGEVLWIKDLGGPDPLLILPLILIIFQIVLQLMGTPGKPNKQQMMSARIMALLSLPFAYLVFSIPTGMGIYWLVGSVFAFVTQYAVAGWGVLPDALRFLLRRPKPDAAPEPAGVAEQINPGT